MTTKKQSTILGLPLEGRLAIRRILLETLPPRWRLVVFSFFCVVGVSGFTAALAYSTKLIVNDVFVDGQASGAWKVALLIVFVSTMRSIFQYLNSIAGLRFSRSISSEYKRKIFASLIDGDARALSDRSPAVHAARLKLLSGSASNVVVNLTNKFTTDALTLIALVGVMVFQDPLMSLMGVVLFPTIFLLVGRLTSAIRGLSQSDIELEGGIASIGAEAVEGIKTVKSYGLEEKVKARFLDAVENVEKRQLRIGKIASLTLPLMETIGGLVIASFVIYASWQTQTNDKTPGEFTAFITAFLLAYQPAERISKLWVSLQRNVIHVERMFKLLDQPVDHYDEDSDKLEGATSSLEFEHVTFGYDHRAPALDDVSFFIHPGERVAIVGPSGSGKTTLIDLVQDFCVPTSGVIRIGGVDLKGVAKNEIRKSVALISQDVFVFDASIAENIREGNPSMTNDELVDVAKRASISEFSGSLEETLMMNIGPQGASLSGGQKQRVAIARAFAKKAKIYIFDEATSALDGDNERAIMRTAVENYKDSTMLFVTHRASTLKWVDRVLLLDSGKIIAFDTHDSLLASSERYKSLFNLYEIGEQSSECE